MSHSATATRKDNDEVGFDPIYHSLANLNGAVNRMTKNDLKRNCAIHGLCQKGVKEVLRKRLKHYYKKEKLKSAKKFTFDQLYRYFIVIDFEATCEEKNPPNYIHEIIEFPAVLIDATTLKVVDKFHSFCRPELNPVLSQFCKNLTGISQAQVNKAPLFAEVFKSFNEWIREKNLHMKRQCCFITDGSWDFSKFLNVQCVLCDIPYPPWARKWLNVKKAFGNFYKLNKPKILEMLDNLGMTFEGKLHSGMDDSLNLSRIVIRLIEDGCTLQVNEKLNSGHLQTITEKEKLKMEEEFLLNERHLLQKDLKEENNVLNKLCNELKKL